MSSPYATQEETANVITRQPTAHETWLETELDKINLYRNEMGNAGELAALNILIYKQQQKINQLKGGSLVMIKVFKRALTILETIEPEDCDEEKEINAVKLWVTSMIQEEGNYL